MESSHIMETKVGILKVKLAQVQENLDAAYSYGLRDTHVFFLTATALVHQKKKIVHIFIVP